MGITRVATLESDIAHRWNLAATCIVHTGTLHGVVYSVVPFIIAVNLTWPAHGVGGNLGYFIKSCAVMLPDGRTGACTLANHQRQPTTPGSLAEYSSGRAINSLNWLPCPFAMCVSRRLECGSHAAAAAVPTIRRVAHR